MLDITRLETEVDYDIVSIYDGEESGDNYLMAELSGLLRDQQQTLLERNAALRSRLEALLEKVRVLESEVEA